MLLPSLTDLLNRLDKIEAALFATTQRVEIILENTEQIKDGLKLTEPEQVAR